MEIGQHMQKEVGPKEFHTCVYKVGHGHREKEGRADISCGCYHCPASLISRKNPHSSSSYKGASYWSKDVGGLMASPLAHMRNTGK